MRKAQSLVVKIWESHKNYLGDSSVALGDHQVLSRLAGLMLPGPHFYYIIDSPTLTFDMSSESVQDLLGIPNEEFSLEKLISLIHPDDMEFFLRCEDVVAYFLRNVVPPDKVTRYKITYCLRERNSLGEYNLYLLQTMTLHTTPEGSLLKVLGTHTQIDHIASLNNHRLSLIGLDGEPSWLGLDVFSPDLFDNFNPYPLPTPKPMYSRKELAVLRLLAEGLDSQQIASELCISLHTLYTHRKNILAKGAGKSITEIVVDCIRKGFF